MWDTSTLFSGENSQVPFDSVIHLAGENVASGRWSKTKKKRIIYSRVHGTRQLVDYLKSLDTPPKTFLCASAIGYYGNRDDERLTESSSNGNGFLAEVCRRWEAEANGMTSAGTRVVNLRFGMVLSPKGGALSKMITPFKAGVGGPIGKGKQYMSWISIRDLVEIIHLAIITETLSGPLNVVSPSPVTNREFTAQLASVIGKPAILPAPPFGLRLLFGEMADEMLLASSRVRPEKLLQHGYTFRDTELQDTLSRCVKGE